MKKLIKWAFVAIMTCVIISAKTEVHAEDAVKIYTYEDLLQVAENPSGNYILMNDIDCTGQQNWTPVDFTGTFDGNNHALLNLSITGVSNEVRTTYDGNMKTYDTVFAGMFGVLENAEVKNLTLYGINVDVTVDKDCFIGTVAGYSDSSTIDNCNIKGSASLHVNGAMFGVGGVVGFGNGAILNTVADTELICVDLDASTRDEQFMGGAYAAGYIDLDNDDITVHGFDSDHGYVHDGGLVGMYGLYPLGFEYAGYITNTWSRGKITFFEDNTNRRAYCSEICGEVLNWTYAYSGCHADFVRDERYDYSKDLYPHGDCGGELSEVNVVSGSCEAFGYTESKCPTCGYSKCDSYTLKTHTLGDFSDVIPATEEATGLAMAMCSNCNAEVYQVTEKLEPVIEEPVVEEMPVEEEIPAEPEKDTSSKVTTILLVVLIAVGVGATVIIVLSAVNRSKRRRNRRR